MKRLSQIGIASGVLLAGFAAGRWTPVAGQHPAAPTVSAEKEAPKKSRGAPRDLDGLLCEVATGKLSGARERIAALAADPVANHDELVKLLVAIALKDGATFDQVFAGLPDEEKEKLISRCIQKLAEDPDQLLRLLVDSKVIARYGMDGGNQSIGVMIAVSRSPGLFFDLIENGELPLNVDGLQRMTGVLARNKATAIRFLQLCQSGRMPLTNELVLAPFISNLSDEDLAKLRAGGTPGDFADVLAEEEQARELFADGNLRGKNWPGGRDYILENGMKQLVERSGIPDMEWSDVPEGFRSDMAKTMLTAGLESHGAQDARNLLDSISKSNLPVEEKNRLLEDSARTLFTKFGETGLAVDYAHHISGGGEDLIVEWVSYDPENARAYVDKIDPSPLRDRLMERIQEVSP